MTALPTLQDLLDPRGRASRSGLLTVALLLMSADVAAVAVIMTTGAAFAGLGALAFKLVSIWVATVGVIKRLHDLELSGWWVAKGLVAVAGWSVVVAMLLLTRFDAADALNPAHAAFWINLTATAVPMLAALIWLHLAHATPGPNRFGAEPGVRGFSSPETEGATPQIGAAPFA